MSTENVRPEDQQATSVEQGADAVPADSESSPVESTVEGSTEAVSPSPTSAPTPEPAEPSQETPVSTEAEAPAAASPAETPAEATAAPAEAAAEEATSSEGPRKKLQLKPTLNPDAAKAIPSVPGGDAEGPKPDPEPVPVPSSDDAEVEAALADALGESAAEPTAAAEGQDESASGEKRVEVPAAENVDMSVQAAIEAAMSDSGDSSSSSMAAEEIQQGKRLKGTVQSVGNDNVILDFGLPMSGAVARRQFGSKPLPEEGAELEVVVDRVDEEEGLILANLPRAASRVSSGDWSSVSVGQVVECSVTKTNKGGLEVSVSSLRGFLPASQVELGFVADLEGYVGQKLRAKVIEVKPERRRLVLSRRAVLAEERAEAEKKLLAELEPDQVRTGRVKTIKDYGAFIDLGGTDGFLPISQMSWVRIEHPSELISEGQEIEVKVLSVDHESKKISLGMRQLAPNPWKTVEDKYPKGSTTQGRVTRTETFGAFVELEPGVEGLVHISELDYRRVKRVTEVLNVGDTAQVQVLDVDPKKKRISLSVKALKEKPEPAKDEDLSPGKGQPYERRRKGPLKGGTGEELAGGLFGNPNDFNK